MATNNSLYVDSDHTESDRRHMLYEGKIFLFSPTPASLALRAAAAEMIEKEFAPLDPLTAQFELSREHFVDKLGTARTAYMHSPEIRQLITELLVEFGCSARDTYVNRLPKVRCITSDGYVTSGIAHVHEPHRDNWWGAPMAQLNWWMPIYRTDADNTIAFHPRLWEKAVANNSENYEYFSHDSADTERSPSRRSSIQPHPPADLDPEPEVRLAMPAGWLVVFSSAQMHSTVPNITGRARFSTDFRTVDIADLRSGSGAVNVDTWTRGTALREFGRLSDNTSLPEDLIAAYDGASCPATDNS